MIISNTDVSYQTQVRPAQVLSMIHQCNLLQRVFSEAKNQAYRDMSPWGPCFYDEQGQLRQWWDTELCREAMTTFCHVALSNHFVCGNWHTCDELEADNPHYFTRDKLKPTPGGMPGLRVSYNVLPPSDEIDFGWLRRFIHSVVIWDISPLKYEPSPIADVAESSTHWGKVADELERELRQAEVSSDVWAELRRT